MKMYLLSLGAGVLVGVFYSLIHTRSPAPPLVALVGLLGILIGERAIPVGKQILAGAPFHLVWGQSTKEPRIFGAAPGRQRDGAEGSADHSSDERG